jgi:hypothetical protein
MAFVRLSPINGENNTIDRPQRLDECLILIGHGCDQRQKDLAHEGDLVE